ncbi:unnamed protein product [Laminaria digitata]
MSVTRPQVAMVATVGLLVASACLLWRRTRSRKEDEEEEWEPVDRDHVVKFFQVINAQSHTQMAGFNQQIAQYRGKLPDQQLTELAVGHFEDQLAKSQHQVLMGMGISLEDMEDASRYYEEQGDAQVKEQMSLLKKLYRAVAQAPAVEEAAKIPTDLTAEKMVTVVKAFFDASNVVIRDVVEELLAEGKTLTDPNTSMEMTVLLQQRNGPSTDAAIKPFNLDSTTIGPAMEKFQDNVVIQNAIRVGGEQQRDLLASYGLV